MRRLAAVTLVVSTAAAAACGRDPVSREPTLSSIRVGYPTERDFDDIPSLMAHDDLRRRGYDLRVTFFATPELAAQALARGDLDFAYGAIPTFWRLADRGAPIVTILQEIRNDYVLVGRPPIHRCADLASRRVAFSSEGSGSRFLMSAYIQEHCPGTLPTALHMPGSAVRAAAILAGSVDATIVRRAEMVAFEATAPGQVIVMEDFGRRWPWLITTGVYSHARFASTHGDVVRDVIRSLLSAYRTVQADASVLAREARIRFGDDLHASATARAYVDAGAWDVDGGLRTDDVRRTRGFFHAHANLAEASAPDPTVDRRYLDDVLRERDNGGAPR